MASAAPLKDIDEKFLQCCICLDRLKEPKILQYLHRHCRDCLKKITKDGDKKVQCPTCRDEHTLPKSGVDGLKTDFNTKNIVEFIQLQESVEQDPLKKCAGCIKKLKVSAYCFRCNDFLCQDCHQYHTTSKILEDHRDHIFSLSDAGVRNLTIDKLSSLKDAPKCHNHPGKLSELVCTSCGNLPICVPCTFGAHKGHDLQEVSSLAKVEREKLNARVADLEQYKGKVLKMQDDIKKAKEELRQTVGENRGQLEEQLHGEQETIKRKIRETDDKLKEKKRELQEKTRRRTSARKQRLEQELAGARSRYEKFCEEKKQEDDAGFEKLQQESDREKVALQEGLDTMGKTIRKLLASLKIQEEENTKKVEDLADHFDGILERFKAVTATASSILAAKHDWTDVQCIPDVRKAIDPLIREVLRELPELGTLAKVRIRSLSSGRKGKVYISAELRLVVDILGMRKGWTIKGIAGNEDGKIIITGKSGNGSHITVINRRGEQRGQLTLYRDISFSGRCDSLSHHETAIVFDETQIGIYRNKDNMYKGRDISDLVTWPEGQCVTSVAVDHTSNNIIVGCNMQQVYVFNDDLSYINTLKLPEEPGWITGITVHEGNLLVCDRGERHAYAATMDEPMCRMLYEFPNPGSAWKPLSVCTGNNHFIYMLWVGVKQRRSMVVQYSPDGSQLLAKRLLYGDHYAECITTVDTWEGEKLVMATLETGKLITYGLE